MPNYNVDLAGNTSYDVNIQTGGHFPVIMNAAQGTFDHNSKDYMDAAKEYRDQAEGYKNTVEGIAEEFAQDAQEFGHDIVLAQDEQPTAQ